jgi:hypothetical protein
MRLFNDVLFLAADGLDLTWMLQKYLSDECGGVYVAQFNPDIHFIASDTNVWDPTRVYDCPNGYHWASTVEAEQLFTLKTVADLYFAKELTYDRCGWTGYEWRGQERRKYRFADSHLTGSFKGAKSKEPEVIGYDDPDQLDTAYFAGAVCVLHDDNSVCYGGKKGSCFIRSGNSPLSTQIKVILNVLCLLDRISDSAVILALKIFPALAICILSDLSVTAGAYFDDALI